MVEKEAMEELKRILEPFNPEELKHIKPSDYVLIFGPLIILSRTFKDFAKSAITVFVLHNILKEMEKRMAK